MSYTPYVILFIVFSIALYFIFRKKKIEIVHLNNEDKLLLNNNVAFYQNLNDSKKLLFEE